MLPLNTITVAHVEALLKATPPEQRADLKPVERDKTLPVEQNYGSDLINLVVVKGYLTKLLVNYSVKSYIQWHDPASRAASGTSVV